MKKQFEILRKTRQYLLELIQDLSIEELNEVPQGFNNNILWNLGHMLASQQGVCYMRAGLELRIDEKFFLIYKPETKPVAFMDENRVSEIKTLFLPVIDMLEKDYDDNLFDNYPTWTNRYGVEHKNIEDTINFLLFHEGLHLGYIMAQKRTIRNEVAI